MPRTHHFCHNCGAAMRAERELLPSGVLALATIDERWDYLQGTFAPPSADVHLRLMGELMAFLRSVGDSTATPQAVLPRDVVRFLISKDIRGAGRTKVHVDSCEWWGVKRDAPCACPYRLAAASVRSQKASLQGRFRDLGFRNPWLESAQAGNPCMAPEVDQYVAMIEREQCSAGVETVQAALVDVSVFNRVIQAALSAWQEAPIGSVARVNAARDAFFYSLLWNSGLRCADALRLHASAVRVFSAALNPATSLVGPGLTVDITRSKTVAKGDKAYRITLWDNDAAVGTSELLGLYQHELRALGLPSTSLVGPLFRKVSLSDEDVPQLGAVSLWADLTKAYNAHLARAGMALPELHRHITLHSFHGSRAARERAMGIDAQVTCSAMGWSLDMYHYYTNGREPLTTDGVRLMAPSHVGSGHA